MKTNWPVKKLGEVCEVVAGGTPSTAISAYWDGNILWITPKDLGANIKTEIFDTDRKITEAGLKNSSAKLLPAGAIILSTRAPIGHLAIAGKPMATNQGCKSLVCSNKIYNRFLYWVLKQNVEELQALGSGATFTEISKKIVENFEIPVPTIGEQKRIVAKLEKILSKISEAVKFRQESEEETNIVLETVIQKVFSNNGKNKKLGDLIKLSSGELLNKDKLNSGPYAVYGGGGYVGQYEKYMYEKPSIGIGRVGARCGIIFKTEPKSWITDNALYIKENSQRTKLDYLFWALQSLGLRQFANQAAQPVISQGTIYSKEVYLPEMREQEKIVAYLDYLGEKVQNLKKLQEEQLAELDALRASVLHQAFKEKL